MRVACLSLCFMLVAGAVTGGDTKTDQAKLQGTWTNDLKDENHVLKFTKDTVSFTFEEAGEKKIVTGTFKIDAAKKPKHMDMMVTGGTVDKFKDKTALAIYELDGDTLKWCANEPGKDVRAEEFPEKQGGGKYLYLIFKRAK